MSYSPRSALSLTAVALTLTLAACSQQTAATQPQANQQDGSQFVYDGMDHSWVSSDDGLTHAGGSVQAQDLKAGSNLLGSEPWTVASSGWGPIERNMSNGEKGSRDGRTLTINGKTYNSGFGTHASSSMAFDLGGKCSAFTSDVGLDDEVGRRGSAVFKVYADGVKLFDSGKMTGGDAAKTVNVDVSGRRELKLVIGSAGDGTNYDHADWAGPVLVDCDASGAAKPPPPVAPPVPAPIPVPAPAPVGTGPLKLPPTGQVAWDWQIGASTDSAVKVPTGVKLIDLDGFTVSAAKIAELKKQGVYTVCYIDAGSYEPGRPDSARYPDSLKIQQDPDWPAEYFLDVTDVFKPNSVLASILTDRMKMCREKGFDALEPDNLQNDENVGGNRITTQQQIDFNGWIADQAHLLGLAVFQKNGPDKVLLRDRTGKMMVEKFDGILNEECQQFSECGPLAEYTKRGKLALNVEYSRNKTLDCNLMAQLGVNALKKDLNLVGATMSGYLRETCD